MTVTDMVAMQVTDGGAADGADRDQSRWAAEVGVNDFKLQVQHEAFEPVSASLFPTEVLRRQGLLPGMPTTHPRLAQFLVGGGGW